MEKAQKETRTAPRQIEDLPLGAEQAEHVKGGVIDPNDKSRNDPNNKSVVDPNLSTL